MTPDLPLSRLAAFARQQSVAPKPLTGIGGTVSDVSRDAHLGDAVAIHAQGGQSLAEIIRVADTQVLVKPFDDRIIPSLGAAVFEEGPMRIRPALEWRGRVINALGEAVDGKGALQPGTRPMASESLAPAALRRGRVDRGLRTGVNVIDIFTPLCFGQRIGIFAGSGVGKSTLLAMMTRAADFDTVVLALTGERGREVREMLEETMAGHLDKTITVVATGDESPMMRRLAPNTATAIAEYFRDLGQNVLLIVDSVTRFAHAAREVAIAAEEPPVSRGYPPSVFSQLPRLLERAGPGITEAGGSITGIYSVLVDGDDHNDPVSVTIGGTLDGHIVLDRAIAAQGRFPAVDIPGSVSRLAKHNWTPEQRKLVSQLRGMVARFEETRDLRAIGAYQKGHDGLLDDGLSQDKGRETPCRSDGGGRGRCTTGRHEEAAEQGGSLPQDRGHHARRRKCDAAFRHLSSARRSGFAREGRAQDHRSAGPFGTENGASFSVLPTIRAGCAECRCGQHDDRLGHVERQGASGHRHGQWRRWKRGRAGFPEAGFCTARSRWRHGDDRGYVRLLVRRKRLVAARWQSPRFNRSRCRHLAAHDIVGRCD